ncbi:DUF4265 domain-containing protein [Spongiibacter sp. KMU-158]|uniref:DUF4265 domain-containing protein n=1 Tax=Spongiibacter pelagi TaxID=2760804 RepID=A0A927GV33_9GAMM|nr:DUF4265 domain-containing protein [Spongiibacter pelagi]MBD2857643.1 DUF4265 domain-containing protein [Spongiibacter pelagi]
MTEAQTLANETRLELYAGIHPANGQPIFEQVLATPLAEKSEHHYKLLKSPLFISGVAALDSIVLNPDARGRFSLNEHSGNLAIRVFMREANEALVQSLNAEMEKLGGNLDINSERALVFSIHFGVGFSVIEQLLDKHSKSGEARWTYGNVYDPETGEPLNWWQELLVV